MRTESAAWMMGHSRSVRKPVLSVKQGTIQALQKKELPEHENRQQLEQFMERVRAILAKQPHNVQLKYYLAHALLQYENLLENNRVDEHRRKIGKWIEESELLAMETVHYAGQVVSYRILLGKVQFKMKKYQAAGEQFTAAVELLTDDDKKNPQKADLFYMIGVCFEKLENETLAFKNFQNALKLRSK